MNKLTMNLHIFSDEDKDFFTNAFESAYNISEEDSTSPEGIEGSQSTPDGEPNQQVTEVKEPPQIEDKEPTKELTPEQIKELYEQHFGKQEVQEPELDEQTKSAIELFQYLEKNPHLVQAMRDIDIEGYNQLNTYVPDELTKKVQEMEEYIQEQRYNAYISELKSKFPDFDEDKVVKYAEEREIYDLEVAYKAQKADSIKIPDEQALREQIKKELLEELKNNSISTQTIIGTNDSKPIESNKPNLTAREIRIAKAMDMSPEEYAKWR